MPTVKEISEIIERMAIAFNGSSFANEYAKRDTVRKLVRAVYALTPNDLEKLHEEIGGGNAVHPRLTIENSGQAGIKRAG